MVVGREGGRAASKNAGTRSATANAEGSTRGNWKRAVVERDQQLKASDGKLDSVGGIRRGTLLGHASLLHVAVSRAEFGTPGQPPPSTRASSPPPLRTLL